MPTSKYQIKLDFPIFDISLMISPQRIPPTVFSVKTRNFFSPKKLKFAYKLTLHNSKPLGLVYFD